MDAPAANVAADVAADVAPVAAPSADVGLAFDALVARLDALAWRLGRGDAVGGDAMRRLADEAAAMGPSLDDARRRALVAAIGRVSAALRDATARIDRTLGALPAGKRAVRGYAAHAGRR